MVAGHLFGRFPRERISLFKCLSGEPRQAENQAEKPAATVDWTKEFVWNICSLCIMGCICAFTEPSDLKHSDKMRTDHRVQVDYFIISKEIKVFILEVSEL